MKNTCLNCKIERRLQFFFANKSLFIEIEIHIKNLDKLYYCLIDNENKTFIITNIIFLLNIYYIQIKMQLHEIFVPSLLLL